MEPLTKTLPTLKQLQYDTGSANRATRTGNCTRNYLQSQHTVNMPSTQICLRHLYCFLSTCPVTIWALLHAWLLGSACGCPLCLYARPKACCFLSLPYPAFPTSGKTSRWLTKVHNPCQCHESGLKMPPTLSFAALVFSTFLQRRHCFPWQIKAPDHEETATQLLKTGLL